jgi:hypothetical protein
LTIGMSVGMKTRMGGGMGGVNMALAKKGLWFVPSYSNENNNDFFPHQCSMRWMIHSKA